MYGKMSNLVGQYALFPPSLDSKIGGNKASLGPAPIGYQPIYQKPPPQQSLRRKRQVEEYEHFAAVVFDDDGQHHMLSSPSLKRQKRSILQEAAYRAQEVINESSDSHRVAYSRPAETPEQRQTHDTPPIFTGSISRPFESSQRYTVYDDVPAHYETDLNAHNSLEDHGRTRRQPRTTIGKRKLPWPSGMQTIRLDETEKWRTWFNDGFICVQQTACRTIAKEWIKVIHPKKQSTHPYNGKMPRSEGGSPNPDRTRPPYWPPDVRHKEPDHIDKFNRTSLLVHLLMNTPQEEIVPDQRSSDRSFTAKELLAALEKKQDEGVTAKWPIVQELVNARDVLEQYEAGGADADATLSVPDWSEFTRPIGPRKRGASSNRYANPTDGEMDINAEEVQSQEDDDMEDDTDDGGDASTQQSFQYTDHNTAQANTSTQSDRMLSNNNGTVERSTIGPARASQPQGNFYGHDAQLTKPTFTHNRSHHEPDRHAIPTNTWYNQSSLASGLPSYGQGYWPTQIGRPSETGINNNYASTTALGEAQHLTKTRPFTLTQPHNQAQMVHDVTENMPYGGESTYPYHTVQPGHGSFGMNQIGDYQSIGYGSQYGMQGDFYGVWESNAGKEQNPPPISR